MPVDRSDPGRACAAGKTKGCEAVKKTTLLHRELSAAVAGMGHTDLILVADAGHPIPHSVDRIDLAVRPGLPRTVDVLEAMLTELSIEAYYVSAEMESASPDLWEGYARILAPAERRIVPHSEFRRLAPTVKYAVRTGEYSPYANIILVGGVGGIVVPESAIEL
jgi:D-ribose pyranase